MSSLVVYDRLCKALAEAADVGEVLHIRDEIEHIKLHARQVKDRAMLVKAIECQMMTERHLGQLLIRLREAGAVIEKGRPPKLPEGESPPATLKEIGVDPKLSATAHRAAVMTDIQFNEAVASMQDRMASNKAILVDPIQAQEKASDLASRRAAHAARTINGGCVEDLGKLALSGFRAKFIGSDPQWKFLTRSAEGEGRSANIHYKTEEVDKIKNLPIGELAADDSMFGMWMVDWCPQDALDLMTYYGFKHVTTLYTWIKTNGEGALDIWSDKSWAFGQGYYTRANPEACWLGTKGNPRRLYADVRQLIIAPIMEHSRKPDEWLARSERLSEGPFLELQARRPRKGWLSWGDELEFTGVAA